MAKIFSCLFSTALFLGFFLPPSAYAAKNAVVIGQVIDLSGENGAIGRDYVAGIKTYFDSMNAKGGMHGKRMQYIVRDDQGKPELSAKLTAELIENEQIEFLIGGVGDATTKAILDNPAFKRSNLILFAPLASARGNDAARVMFWRPTYRQEAGFLFSHFDRLGIKDVGIAIQDSADNEAAYQNLSAQIHDRGMKLSGIARIGAHGEKSVAEAKRLAAAHPGFVLVIGDSISTGLFLKEFRPYASNTFVAGTSLINLATLAEVAGTKAVEWTVFSQVVPNPNASTSLLQAEHNTMMKKYRDEAVSALTLEGFAVAKTLAKSMQQAKDYRAALQELIVRNSDTDLGGLSIVWSPKNNYLSNYLDIALFRKASGLVF